MTVKNKTKIPPLHSTHNTQITHHLHILINLSPSCNICHIEYFIEEKNEKKRKIEFESEYRNTKQSKIDEESSSMQNSASTVNNANVHDKVEKKYLNPRERKDDRNAQIDKVTSLNNGMTNQNVIIDDLMKQLRKALPDCTCITTKVYDRTSASKYITTQHPSLDSKTSIEEYLSAPIGEIMHEYSRTNKKDQKTDYILTIASGSSSNTQQYHNRVQNLAIWYIETADAVDVSTLDGGFWKVMYLFQKHSNKTSIDEEKNLDSKNDFKYSFVGYTTLFHFYSPFRIPKGGQIVRICQVFIMPPFQRSGHGAQMIHQVYRMAQDQDEIVEINVEDPAPAFVALRDKIDFETFLNYLKNSDTYFKKCEFDPLLDEKATHVATELKITMAQVKRAYEMFRLHQLNMNHSTDLEKKYRIMVKKRLLKSCKEELMACGGKEKQKLKLGELFDELKSHYCKIVAESK